MAAVFEAEQLGLGRRVALKTLHPDKQDPQQLRRLAREAEVASGLHHPNIVQITDVHIAAGGPSFLVMELLEGEALDTRMARGPLSVRETIRIGRQILDGLACAHDHKLVHRDLKPANVFLTTTPALGEVVKLLDFGVVRIEDRRTRLTRTGNIVGTPAYMAPEQVRGEGVGPASDLWSLGVVLYELLGGRPPFDAETWQELLGVILSQEAKPLSQLAPHIPVELAGIVHHALQKDPAKRFGDARHMQSALADVEQRLDSRERSPSPASTARRTPILGGLARGGEGVGTSELYPGKGAGGDTQPDGPSPLDLRQQLSTDDNYQLARAHVPLPQETTLVTREPVNRSRQLLMGLLVLIGVLIVLAAGTLGYLLFA